MVCGDSTSESYARSAYSKAKGELDAELMKQSINNPIVAVAAGVVTNAGYNCRAGFMVTIDHTSEQTGKVQTVYCHLRRWPEVQVGDVVGPGTLIGYEGTTGNSGGLHLHIQVTTNGSSTGKQDWESPAAFFGPIFSPFYNEEKAGEVMHTYSSNEILALSSEYFSLIRTVLLAKFNNNALVEDVSPTPYIPTAIFTKISGDADGEYVVFPHADAYFSGDNLIVKENNNGDEKYWECQVEDIDDVLEKMKGQKKEEEFEEYKKYINTYLLSGRDIYKVISKSTITFSVAQSIQRNTIKVRTKPGSPKGRGGAHASAPVKWGNNVPYYPLFKDKSESYDLNLLKAQKIFELSQYDSGGEAGRKQNKDIGVWSKFFDENSPQVDERIKNARTMFPFMADIDSPFAVPIYDGPVSIEMYEALVNDPDSYGLAGTNSGDLQKLQVAMRTKGFDPEHKMNVDGIFDEETKATIIRASEAMQKAGFPVGDYFIGAGLRGQLGVVGSENDNGDLAFYPGEDLDGNFAWRRFFGTTVVTNWNAYVTYGTWDDMVYASQCALSNASLQSGIHYTFLEAIAERESSLMNRCESQEPVYYAPFTGSFSGRYETEAGGAPSNEAVILYRGEMKTVRRAQGLMQCIWGSALGKGAAHGIVGDEQILDAIRMPNTSAIFAADEFQGFITKFKRNSDQIKEIRKIADRPAWKAAAKDAHVDAQTLVMYAMCCYRYSGSDKLFADNDKGKFATSALNAFYNSTYSNKVFKKGGGSNYFDEVITTMIKNAK